MTVLLEPTEEQMREILRIAETAPENDILRKLYMVWDLTRQMGGDVIPPILARSMAEIVGLRIIIRQSRVRL